MSKWLLKSEPSVFSWSDLVAAGASGEPWTGVRNHQAKLHLKAMQVGDLAFYYHSQAEKAVVGVAEVIRAAYQDPTDQKGIFVCVDIAARTRLPRPFSLAEAKADPELSAMALVRTSRLSVQPVTEPEWSHICRRVGLEM